MTILSIGHNCKVVYHEYFKRWFLQIVEMNKFLIIERPFKIVKRQTTKIKGINKLFHTLISIKWYSFQR